MIRELENISIKQLCKVIERLAPTMDDYLYVYDIQNDFYYIAPDAAERFLLPGHTFQNAIQMHEQFVYPPDLEQFQKEMENLLTNQQTIQNIEYRWLSKTKMPIWINCRGYIIREENTPLYLIGCINEIGTKQKADNISGLLGESSLRAFFETSLSTSFHGYVLRLDLDDFKEINEKHGIEYGDRILRKTAQCISSVISPDQKLYRIVSDEYLILDTTGGTMEDALKLYKKIRQTLELFVEENHYEAVITISGGVLESCDIEEYSYSNIMKLSEFALNEAKRHGKNRCYLFSIQDYQQFLWKNELSRLLRKAVNHNFEGFEVYFQPVFCMNSNRLYGAEALMRFYTKEHGFLPPGEFIPILEETGLIIPVGKWILHQALAACKKMQEHIPEFRISINISYIQIQKSDIIHEIISAVKEHLISPSYVIIELTESGMLESNSHFTKLCSKLNEQGISLALDDFGTGYSNFHYLYDLHPDIIKIDRNFTAKALQNDYEYHLLSLMSHMIHHLDLRICVEGIETREELHRIQEIQPDYSQGYYFGKPCSYTEFTQKFLSC